MSTLKRHKTTRREEEDPRTDLTQLFSSSTNPTNDDVGSLLLNRLNHDNNYTRLSANALLAISNSTRHQLSKETASVYAEQGYRRIDTQPSGKDFFAKLDDHSPLQPHIYELASNIYFALRRTGEDQSIVSSGLSGSGKTENLTHLIRQLCLLAEHGKKDARLHTQIIAAQTVLGSFGCAKNLHSIGSSRHGRFQELQFNERGRIVGLKLLAFALDKSRVTQPPSEHRNYNVFYELLAGATSEERIKWHIPHDAPDKYPYLAASRCIRSPGVDDAVTFEETREALKALGLKTRGQNSIFGILSTILHLGSLNFFDEANKHSDSCTVRNPEELAIVAELLGVTTTSLSATLTYRTTLIGRELCTVVLNAEAAARQRDALARSLYSLLFAWIVEAINNRLCVVQQTNFVAIVDVPGMAGPSVADTPPGDSPQGSNLEGFLSGSYAEFEEFLFNMAAEKSHHNALMAAFDPAEASEADLISDGLSSPWHDLPNPYTALQEVASRDSLLTDPTTGLASLINAECLKTVSGDANSLRLADSGIVSAFSKAHPSHPKLFTGRPGDVRFVVSHTASAVAYAADGWFERAGDSLSPDFVNLFRAGRNSSFAASLFNGEGVVAQSHPRDARTIVSAHQLSRIGRAPSRRFPKTTTTSSAIAPLPAKSPGVSTINSTGTAVEVDFSAPAGVTSALDDIFASVKETRVWTLLCLRTAAPEATVSILSYLRYQARLFGLADLARRRAVADFFIGILHAEFVSRFSRPLAPFGVTADGSGSPRDQISQVLSSTNLSSQHAILGNQKVWLSLPAWRLLETGLRCLEKENRLAAKSKSALPTSAAGFPTTPSGSQNLFSTSTSSDQLLQQANSYPSFPPSGVASSVYGDDDNYSDYGGDAGGRGYGGPGGGRKHWEGSVYGDGNNGSEAGGDTGSEFEWQSEIGLPGEKGADTELGKSNEVRGVLTEDLVEESTITSSRKFWVRTTWCLTWWIPSCCLSWRGMKRQDIQMAWREKVALCILIATLSGIIVFFIIGLSNIICPKDKLFSPEQVANHESTDDLWVSLRGKVYDITYLAKSPHGKSSRLPAGVSAEDMLKAVTLAETQHDVTGHFPIPLELGCKGIFNVPANTPPQVSDIMLFDQNYTLFRNLFTPNAEIGHPLPFFVNDNSGLKTDRNFYADTVLPKLNDPAVLKGSLAIELTKISEKTERNWFVYNKVIYDLTPLIYTQSIDLNDKDILNTVVDPVIVAMATDPRFFGQDVTDTFDKKFDAEAKFKNDPAWKKMNMDCLNNVFRAGILDERQTLKCQLNNYILLGSSIVLVGVILIKFLAALQLGGRPTPEDHDKFVILQVPCYTEGEESLKKTIDSLAALKYDDKRKLLFIICDGMIIGGGNDRPTPKIVLDLLGVDPKMDSEPLAFRSIGDGSLQHNFGKVYSGLYECEGHVVPYLVVVKVGKPSERARPGNRGKRDSQIILMRFLNSVHFDSPMSPMELEIYHQIKNVIGVHPSFYEYVLMVDADTEVMPDALNRLISTMLHDSQIVGLCGETQLANEDRSWTTMIQVYEYYISHHLAKAFESLFGSVTCLPGCFCMYRIRSPVKGSPLIISTNIISEYSECIVDTLHKKNLLSLGEDRYLTTLTMKHFPNYKMSFTPDAICKTVAPDKWEVLLSQRRRWINSTIHNLAELIFLPELCGFCCFSMRFVVFIDLFGTLILPATVVYLVYLLFVVFTGMETLPIVSLIMMVAVYGLQAIIFIVKRQWQHIGWMVIYILAIPIFSFALPIYAFWHFDDFSWGNTRVVVGDNKKQVFVAEEEKFDERAIPLRKWSDYEQELWEVGSQSSVGSRRTAVSKSSHQSRGVEPERSHHRNTNNRNSSRSPVPRRPNSEYRISGVYSSSGSESGQLDNNRRHSHISAAGTEYDHPLASLVPTGVDPNTFARNRPRPLSIMSQRLSINPSDPALVASMSPSAASPSPAPQPTDEEVVVEIRHILGNENLMSLTKKQVREKLGSFFGCDLTLRRDFINGTIEAILQGKL